MEKALFDYPIVLQFQCDVNEKYLLISRKFSGIHFKVIRKSLYTSDWQLKTRIPSGFFRILDLPYLKAGIRDFKAK